MAKDNKKGWYFLCAAVVGIALFICFSIYIKRSTIEGSLNQAMQDNGTKMVSYQLHPQAKYVMGNDSIYEVTGANGKKYNVDLDHNQLVVSATEVK
jgi:hypothetical protein